MGPQRYPVAHYAVEYSPRDANAAIMANLELDTELRHVAELLAAVVERAEVNGHEVIRALLLRVMETTEQDLVEILADEIERAISL